LKLVSVRASKAFAMLMRRRAKRTLNFVSFMTVVIGEGVGGCGELSYELGNAWGNESSICFERLFRWKSSFLANQSTIENRRCFKGLKGGVGYNYTCAFIDKRTGEAKGR
jgi:hypothetical protein